MTIEEVIVDFKMKNFRRTNRKIENKMEDMNADAFNFDAMKTAVGVDPFAKEANKFAKDERFYTLTKDKDGNGGAVIRFLPDSEKGMIQRLFKINTTIINNGKKRFVSEFSPSTIGLPDPFQEKWQDLWNEGEKEDTKDANGNITKYGAKTYSRGIRYVVNIKVEKDPACPENVGKVFLYEMSGTMKDKIQGAVDPSEQNNPSAVSVSPGEAGRRPAGQPYELQHSPPVCFSLLNKSSSPSPLDPQARVHSRYP